MKVWKAVIANTTGMMMWSSNNLEMRATLSSICAGLQQHSGVGSFQNPGRRGFIAPASMTDAGNVRYIEAADRDFWSIYSRFQSNVWYLKSSAVLPLILCEDEEGSHHSRLENRFSPSQDH
jgi:hypothetical protein